MGLQPTTLSLLIGGLLVLALLVYGARDLARFSLMRAWAIRGVVFRESVRRRVLWVTPLAMLAVLLLIQLQDPVDEADAVRQATRSCLFASGLVALVISLILSSTNLPREIANRVIFTIASKPVTRFELLVGKVFGFAQLSALVLLIMGAFTLLLLWILNFALVERIEAALQSTLPNRRPYLQYLADEGLLQAQRIDNGDDLQVYSEPPADPRDDSHAPRYFLPTPYFAAVPFRIPAQVSDAVRDNSAITMVVRVRMHWKLSDPEALLPGDPPLGIVNLKNLPEAPPPWVSVQLVDVNLNSLVALSQIEMNQAQLPRDAGASWEQVQAIRLDPDQTYRVTEEARFDLVHVLVYGLNTQYRYGITPDSVQIAFRDEMGREFASFAPAVSDKPRPEILLRTFMGTSGIGLSGPEDDLPAPIGILAFRDTVPISVGRDRKSVELELRAVSERTGGILDESDDTVLEASVHNVTSGYTSEPAILFPETGFPVILRIPPQAVEGGHFDLRLQTQSRGHIVSVRGSDVKLIVKREPFAYNLAKGLLVLWLLSVLVIVAGLTFSTFVSWPIAVTMAVFGLLGRWVAGQLGDDSESWGRQAAEGIFGSGGDATSKEAVRVSVNALSEFFETVTAFLPDVGVYGVVSELERGVAVNWSQIGSAAAMTAAFALPLVALGYIVLRNKEVAP